MEIFIILFIVIDFVIVFIIITIITEVIIIIATIAEFTVFRFSTSCCSLYLK